MKSLRAGLLTAVILVSACDSVSPTDEPSADRVGSSKQRFSRLVLNDEDSRATAINERGQVVGWIYNLGQDYPAQQAMLWDNGQSVVLDDVPSEAYAINERGQVVGAALIDDNWNAVLWDKGQRVVLDDAPSVAFGINAGQQVVGVVNVDGDLLTEAALWNAEPN